MTDIDGNTGIPLANDMIFTYPVTPLETMSPSCVGPGPIGVTKNGVVIYNAADARGEDAVAREIVDIFGGHPARDEYHYHFIPERLDNEALSDGHSGIVGYINDGYPIYGYKGSGGKERGPGYNLLTDGSRVAHFYACMRKNWSPAQRSLRWV